ncbi:MAG: glutamine--tRNA ligase/YqeY domain fusion protein [Polaromonas sp.]|uniref:glutamine--tRNA ligase/YqeY domain fusion protein n=1 Tax=Polaromonas sp. TaxID=1869339 RepID=UPI00272FB2B3|nr:glutamine--tRNA ligase/YqeY domain fusion protein [Polaromonas sp.]MDP2257561.1 glutamine--tRNA ligase/YqeY domain fusion protein [Polaromonas sp.]
MTSPAPSKATHPADKEAHKPSNFLRQIIEKDLAEGTYASRRWGGSPGDAAHHAAGQPDPAKIRTRFPPEPNGYLHVGHAKSICINFGLARDYGGVCHLRFDDTNPEKEELEYVNSIKDAVKWLGFGWENGGESNLYQASDYFDFMYRAAEHLIEAGHAYVDEQTVEQMRINRGDFGHPGTNSPFRSRTAAENLARFHEMKAGLHEDGSMVLRAKIDMASPNINLRDPAIYRIRRATHHNTGDKWCIYPMYTFAHPIEDALENITHSLCTLEFEDQRPFYDWLLERLTETTTLPDGRVLGGLISAPPPRQYEFARLNLTYVVTSKRKLAQLVYDHKVSGWDDPRMPTLVGLRRRGYTPEAIQLFAERIGVTKSDSWIDYSTLEGCLRETLDGSAARAMAVLDPVKLVLTNWDEVMGAGKLDDCSAPIHPHHPELGKRNFKIGKEVWIERGDFEETPPKGFFRLFPGNKVRLKYGHVIECTGCTKDAEGKITEVQATLIPDTKSGTPGSDSVKVKGVITWVAVADGLSAEVRMYDRLFLEAQPDAGGKDFIESLNPNSLKVVTAMVEPSLASAKADDKFQFERHGYFVADRVDHAAGRPVFNLAVGLKDSWGK